MNALKTMIRAVAVLALLPVLCVMVAVIWFTANRMTAEAEIAQQLTALDQQLAVPRGQIPEGITADGFLPMQLGNFQRETWVNDYKCSNDTGFPQPCFSTQYTVDHNANASQVWVTILKKSTRRDSTLSDLFGPVSCGQLVAYRTLRTVSPTPYSYGTCPQGLFASPELYLLTWQNGNWLVQLNGSYDTMSQFIAAYPY